MLKVSQNKTHNFSVLYYTHDENIDINDISLKYQEILKISQIINRREVCKSRLNMKQQMAHDLIIRAMALEEEKFKINRGSGVSRLQLVVGKGSTGKLHILDSVISILK